MAPPVVDLDKNLEFHCNNSNIRVICIFRKDFP
jgi:hypothetical protein